MEIVGKRTGKCCFWFNLVSVRTDAEAKWLLTKTQHAHLGAQANIM